MIAAFTHHRLPQRVLFGRGHTVRALTAELEEHRGGRILLVGSHRAVAALPDLSPVAHVSTVRRHVPIEDAVAGRGIAEASGAEIIVSIGGGSATGLAKAIALTTRLPIIAIPTTYAGSEATPIWGITEQRTKRTGTDDGVLPAAVIYDADHFAALPSDLAVSSAINALAHGIDALWGPHADPFTSSAAEGGIRWIAAALRQFDSAPQQAAEAMLVGTYLTSTAFAVAGSGMHHKICHVLGGAYDLPHAALHAVILPHVLAFNSAADESSRAAIGRALGDPNPLEGLQEIYRRVGALGSLTEIGFDPGEIDEAAALCLPSIPASNPRPVDIQDLRALLAAASTRSAHSSRKEPT